MAEIKHIDMHDSKIDVTLSLSREEYKILGHHTTDMLVLPYGKSALTHDLTTGKLGNSNRIMMPKKLLESFSIKELDKKVPSNIFITNGDSYLLMRIKKSELGIPKFGEDLNESHDGP